MEKGETNYYYLRFGRNVRSARKQQGIGLRPLALMSGMDYAEISKIENGKANPTLRTMIKLAESLDVDLGELFDA